MMPAPSSWERALSYPRRQGTTQQNGNFAESTPQNGDTYRQFLPIFGKMTYRQTRAAAAIPDTGSSCITDKGDNQGMIIRSQLKNGDIVEFDTRKYPTMAEIRQCLSDGGHIAVVYEHDNRKAKLVWAPFRTQPMKPSTVLDLDRRGVIKLSNSRSDKDGWSADYFSLA